LLNNIRTFYGIILYNNEGAREYLYPHQRCSFKIPWGKRVSKANVLNEQKLKFDWNLKSEKLDRNFKGVKTKTFVGV